MQHITERYTQHDSTDTHTHDRYASLIEVQASKSQKRTESQRTYGEHLIKRSFETDREQDQDDDHRDRDGDIDVSAHPFRQYDRTVIEDVDTRILCPYLIPYFVHRTHQAFRFPRVIGAERRGNKTDTRMSVPTIEVVVLESRFHLVGAVRW